jgi:hypothetical protein
MHIRTGAEPPVIGSDARRQRGLAVARIMAEAEKRQKEMTWARQKDESGLDNCELNGRAKKGVWFKQL